jgi:prepilin-type processing-associated H-X9-DG protein
VIWVTERASSNNILGVDNDCVVTTPVDQVDTYGVASHITYKRPSHGKGKLSNYLFVDGHVSTMAPTETIYANSRGVGAHGGVGYTSVTAILTLNGWTNTADPKGMWTRDDGD